MSFAGNKKARWQGGLKENADKYNININTKNVNMSGLMIKRIANIAAKTEDFAEFEHAAIITLAAELKAYSEIAKALPDNFVSALTHCKPDILSPIERGAIAIIESETETLADLFARYPYEEHLALKFDALAALLQEDNHV